MKQIHKILIANRGEIASRIIRTCRRLGIESVAVFSEPDREAPFVLEADEALALGGNSSAETYLDQARIIRCAQRAGAQAIHPGYGFLAENAGFAQAVADAGLVFIGPEPAAIEAMGSKARAREIMIAHGVPVVPGYQGSEQSLEHLALEAEKIGYPLLVKAAAGGGGKGMRVVRSEFELKASLEAVMREAKSAFGDDTVILERYFDTCRHIEVQVFGDAHGNVIHLGERECSLQRRHQKVVEEAPSPSINADQRGKFTQYGVIAAKSIGYTNAGTVEFLLTQEGDIYFLEMNTRLQVEHPVTEEVTGLDLVEWQIRVAEGQALPLSQAEINFMGHAIECRLYAEDAENGFLPATGTVQVFAVPEGENLRLESGIEEGSEVGIWYDPMLAKLVSWGEDRAEAIRLMQYALKKMYCLGLKTNREFLFDLISHPEFASAHFHTRTIETTFLPAWNLPGNGDDYLQAARAATAFLWLEREQDRSLLHQIPSGWRNNFFAYQSEKFLAGGEDLEVRYRFAEGGLCFPEGEGEIRAELVAYGANELLLELDGFQQRYVIAASENQIFVQLPHGREVRLLRQSRFPEVEKAVEKGACVAPMPGQVVKVLVSVGDQVEPGQGLIILSSMKMENTLSASEAGQITEVFVAEGDFVEADKMLLKVE